MNSITEYFNQSELALAAYANLIPGVDPVPALQDASVGMSAAQAAAFAATYTVVDQYTDQASGFSATVFERGGQRYMAIRGTEGWLDYVADADLALSGAAAKQTISLFNYVQRLSGVKGQSVAQLEWNGQDYVLNQAGAIGLLDTPLSEVLAVTGHSLGGHLAMAFGRLFPQSASQIYTYNAPGFINAAADNFFTRIDAALARTGSTFADAVTTNLYGSGLNIIAGYANDHGTPQEIFLEGNAHSIVDIIDSLAVYNLLASLDPTLNTGTTGINAITNILKASSNVAANSLESAVSAIGKLFNVSGTTFTSNEFDGAGRDNLYKALNGINTAIGTNTFTLRDLSAFNATQIASIAQNNLAYRYALVNGNPFALVGDDTIYSGAGELDLFNTADHTGNLTSQYLTDRAAWLTAKMSSNASDKTVDVFGTTAGWAKQGGEEIYYENTDAADVTASLYQGDRTINFFGMGDTTITPVSYMKQIKFGAGQGDTLTGDNKDDRLYGMNGDDILTGGKGNDTLEGGQGADTYLWNSGDGLDSIRDTDGLGSIKMNGQTLTAGETKDGGHTYTSKDAAGNSHTYTVLAGDVNAAGGATLLIDGTIEVFNYRAGDLNLTLGDSATPQTVTPPATTTDILGDPLIHSATIAPGGMGADWQATNTYNFVTDADGAVISYDVDYYLVDANGNPTEGGQQARDDIYTLHDSAGNDHFISGAGNDAINLNAGGDDLVETGAGNDTINKTSNSNATIDLGDGDDHLYTNAANTGTLTVSAGAGRDWIEGGANNDLLQGGMDGDILAGGLGDDRLYGDSEETTEQAIANGNADIASGLQGDWLSGNSGDDTLITGAGNDVLSGGGGNDLLIAGAGDDYILGDADYNAQSFDWTVTANANGNTTFQPSTGATDPADSGNDIIYAGDGADRVWAGMGNDVVYGEAGADKISGEAGNDVLFGGTGNDILHGGENDDYLDGGADNDTLWGGNGNDILAGGTGDDKLYGEAGANYLEGGDGADILNSGGPGSSLYGGAGNDDISAAGGGNMLDGGAGDDILVADGDDNYLDGGDGVNTVQAVGNYNSLFAGTGNDDLAVWGDGNYLDAGDGANTLYAQGSNNELFAGTGNDTLQATGGNNTLDGGDGTNLLVADMGGNTLISGAGDDTLSSTGGNSTLNAGDGNNTLIATDGHNTLHAGSGNDSLSAGGGYNTLDGGDGADYLLADGGNNTLIGGAGNDTLIAHGGGNMLDGGAGNDILQGGDGGNILAGGAGDDTLIGGAGGDVYVYNIGDGKDAIYDSNTGGQINTLRFGDGIVTSNIVLGLGSLKLDLGNGDEIHIADYNPNDALNSSSIQNFEFADGTSYTAAELITTLGFGFVGTDANDIITGTSATDRIAGGRGDDTLIGGMGGDTYIYNAGDGNDTITDSGGWYWDPVNAEYVFKGDNTLELGAGIAADAITTRLDAVTGKVALDVAGGSIDLGSTEDFAIQTVRFADGTTQNISEFLTQHPLAVNGSNTADTIYGTPFSDIIQGGAGNDAIQGQGGGDTYVYNLGDGEDVIRDTPADDNILRFGAGITPDMIKVRRSGNDLVIDLGPNPTNSGRDSINVAQGIFSDGSNPWGFLINKDGNATRPINFNADPFNVVGIQTLKFADGVTLNLKGFILQQGFAQTGADGADVLSGENFYNPTLPDGIADRLEGGKGDDTLIGGSGDDVYVFNRGDGNDTIVDATVWRWDSPTQQYLEGGNNTLVFGDGISASDITVKVATPTDYLVRIVLDLGNGDSVNIGAEYDPAVINIKFADGSVYTPAELMSQSVIHVDGTDGADSLVGTVYTDHLRGFAGDDSLLGAGSDDVLNGGTGNDYAEGGKGNDAYIYNQGDGADTISDSGWLRIWGASMQPLAFAEPNTIRFGAGIAADTITPLWDGNAVTLDLGNGDSIAIGSLTDIAVQTLRFDDGTSIAMDAFLAQKGIVRLQGTAGNDVMATFGNGQLLQGAGGDDTLYGSVLDDQLAGGAGNDTLAGASGNDTYVYNLGDGADTIVDTAVDDYLGDDINTLRFGAGITADMISPIFDNVAQTLTLNMGGGNSIAIGQISNLAIQTLQFADGSQLTVNELLALKGSMLQIGTAGDDILYGSDYTDRVEGLAGDDEIWGGQGNDTLVGGAGNDILSGDEGNDVYIFNRGDGVDAINDRSWHWGPNGSEARISEVNILKLGEGISADMMTLVTDQNGNSVLDFGGGDSVNIGWHSSNWYYDETGIQQIQFADGSVIAVNDMVSGSILPQTLANQVVYQDDSVNFVVQQNPFYVSNGQTYTYFAELADGNALPGWLTFDAATQTFSGVPTNWDVATLNLTVAAVDASWQYSVGNFVLDVRNVNDAPTIIQSLDDQSATEGEAFSYSPFQMNTVGNILTGAGDAGTQNGVNVNFGLYFSGINLPPVSALPTNGGEYLYGTTGNDTIDALDGNDVVAAGAGDDSIYGGAGADYIEGGGGSDILSGGSGNDLVLGDLTNFNRGSDLLAGGAGNDELDASRANSMLIGGQGSDYITGFMGNSVILFNRGDGNDSYGMTNGSTYGSEPGDTLSLGGGIGYSDLSFSRNGNNLILNVGNGETLTFNSWLNTGWFYKVANRLQIVAESMPGYDQGSADPLLNKRIQQFDFIGLADQFQAAIAANPAITTWQIAPYLADFYLGGSDTSAIGGDMAYLYGRDGNMDYMSDGEIHAQLGDISFGINSQALNKVQGSLRDLFNDVDFIHGDKLTYSLGLADGDPLPSWLSFDAATQTFGGTPGSGDAGTLNVAVTATDTGGLTATSSFQLNVGLSNVAPAADFIEDQVTPEDALFNFVVPANTFVDANGDALTFSATMADGTALPSWLAFDAATQTFSGIPVNWDVGALSVRVTATDSSGLGASSDFVLDVLNVNDAPTVNNPLGDQSATVGEAFNFTFAVNTSAGDSFMNDASDPNVPVIDGISLDGDAGDNTLTGTLGNDYLYGSSGNDVLDGGAGNDELEGDLGNDTFLFGRGYGQDVVYEWDNTVGNVDTVRFAADVLPGDVTVYEDQWNDNIILSINGTNDTLTIDSWLSSDAAKVEQFVFADGTVWGVNDIMSIMAPLPAISIGSDEIIGTEGNDYIKALAGDDYVTGEGGDDVLVGGTGDDYLFGGTGSVILNGGSGWDSLYADRSYSDLNNDLLAGGAGGDNVTASVSNDLLIGGTGNDDVIGDDGNDVVLFNRGDGNDWYGSSISENSVALAERTDTISLGGGIAYADLSFELGTWNDSLVLNLGNGDAITFDGWFDTSWQDNKAISTLQLIVEAMPGYDPNSVDPLLNKRIQQFDFLALANQFETELAADPSITTWQLAPHLGNYHLGGSDTEAIGGDMAYLYGKNGNLDGLTEVELRAQLSDATFGTTNQMLTKTSMGFDGGVFGDVDFVHGDSLAYSATLADGSPLPAWLTFDAATATFSGTLGSDDAGILNVAVTATDTGGLSATSTYRLDVVGLNAAPVAVSDMVAIGENDAQATIAVAGLLANDTDPDAGDVPALNGFDGVTANGNAVTLVASENLVLNIGDRYQSLGVGQTATDSFGYSISDAAGATSAATVNVIIAGENDAPVVANALADQATLQDAAFSFTIPVDAFADIDNGDVLTYSASLADPSTSSGRTALPDWLTFDAATQTFSGTPLNGDVGNLNVLVTATDTSGLSASSAFTLDVLNINDAPVAANDVIATNEDAALTPIAAVALLANDHDIDVGDTFALAGFDAVSANGNAVTQDAAGNLVFDIGNRYQSLAAGQVASDTFNYTIADATGVTSTAQVSMTITGLNDAPVTITDTAYVQEDLAPVATGNVLSNDSDVDQGALLQVANAGIIAGSYGNLSLNTDGSYRYTLDTALVQSLGDGQTVTEAFAYQASDGITATPATLSITINGTNDAPVVANRIAGQQTDEDVPFSYIVPANTFADIDNGDALTYSALRADGTALPDWLTFDAVTMTFSGTPGNWDVGNYSVAVTATDTGGLTANSVFAINVANVNDAPVVSMALFDQGVLEDVPFNFTVPAETFDDVDLIHGDTLAYSASLADGAALPGWLTFDAATQTFSGTPLNSNVGNLNVLVTVTDTGGLSASSAFNLNIVNVNDTPTANADSGTATEDGGAVLLDAAALLTNDTDPDSIHGDALNIIGVSQAASGAPVSLLPSAGSGQGGAVQYNTGALFQSLGQGETVTDSFSYTIADTAGATSTATVTMTVNGVNDAPVAVADVASVQEDLNITAIGNVLANDSDVDQGTVLSVANAGVFAGNYGSLLLNVDGSYSYALDNASLGAQSLAESQTVTDTFAYQATDGIVATPSTLTLTVTGLNDAPVAVADVASVQEDLNITATGNVLSNDSDIDQDTVLSVTDAGTYQGSYGSLSLAADGSYSYDTDNASLAVQSLGRTAQVVDHFGYTATDGMAGASSVLDVFLSGTNDAPILVAPLADQNFTFHKDFSWQMPSGSFTDIDQGDTLDYAATLADGTALPEWLSFDAATQTFSGETPKEIGFVDIRVTATDKVAATGSTVGSLSASDVFRITVSHGNEGVGNGEDAPPPGHGHNHNDGAGASPGHPGSKGGKDHSGDYASHSHGNEPSDHSSAAETRERDAKSKHTDDSDSHDTEALIRSWFDQQSVSEQYSPFDNRNLNDAWESQIDRQVNRSVSRGISGDVSKEWERMNARLKNHLEQSGSGEALLAESGTGSMPSSLLGSQSYQNLSLSMGNSQQMKGFSGLREGLERLGG